MTKAGSLNCLLKERTPMNERTSPATIMVVDDTPENLDLLREMLQ